MSGHVVLSKPFHFAERLELFPIMPTYMANAEHDDRVLRWVRLAERFLTATVTILPMNGLELHKPSSQQSNVSVHVPRHFSQSPGKAPHLTDQQSRLTDTHGCMQELHWSNNSGQEL